ncbi:MAG: flagellar basal body P-ring formation chaperone FlgA, partial [Candidatus Adiutrix sp.]|nr:flagellar basal body P-ring formation chaperone FlgA [Candidatus Adiutrix sp.]
GANPASLSGYIHFIVGGRSVSRARVAAQIDLSVPAVVAARPLSRGHVLAEGDLRLGQVPFAQAKEALTDPAAPLGSALKFNVAAGEVVGESHLTKSMIVRRGEAVTMIARQGGLKVTAAGQARQDGALGDVISVTNLSSKKNVSARIIGPHTVEIIF